MCGYVRLIVIVVRTMSDASSAASSSLSSPMPGGNILLFCNGLRKFSN